MELLKSSNGNDAYLKHLLESILRKRQFSIQNAHKTDLYSTDELHDFMTWFEDLISLVQRTPPTGYVRTLIITEGEQGQVLSIYYKLFDSNDKLSDTEFIVI